MTAQVAIKLNNLHKSFATNKVLQGVDLEIFKGQSLVVLGGSGSGKSVMLKLMLGLMRPDKGAIKKQASLDKFGMLFQGSALFDSLPVWQNIAFKLIHSQNLSKDAARALAVEKLSLVGLGPDVGNLFPSELSGGMQKRVALARAIAADPEILFFDEPTTGLDPIMADVINNLIVKLVKQLGATAVSITHDMASTRKIADRVAMLYKGKIIWAGDIDQIDHSDNPYLDQFIHGRAEGPIQMDIKHG